MFLCWCKGLSVCFLNNANHTFLLVCPYRNDLILSVEDYVGDGFIHEVNGEDGDPHRQGSPQLGILQEMDVK